MEESNDSQCSSSLQPSQSEYVLTSGRKSKPRKLLSVNNTTYPCSITSSGKSKHSIPNSKPEESSSISLPVPENSLTLRNLTAKSPITGILPSERIVYDEKAQPRKGPLRLTRYKDFSSKARTNLCNSGNMNDGSSDDGLSDFVVNDSASESELRKPPRSMRKKNISMPFTRKLHNRRNVVPDDEDFDGASTVTGLDCISLPSALEGLSLSSFSIASFILEKNRVSERDVTHGPLSKSKREIQMKDTTLSHRTAPTSPSKPRLQSPTKSRVQIPQSPHRQSIDAFWTQDVINDWNDVYSPQKTQKIKKFFDLKDGDADLSPSESPSRKENRSPSKRNKAELEKKKIFESRKHSLATNFLEELDQVITGGQLAVLAESTGGVKISWSKTLTSTAGRAKWQRETIHATEAMSTSSLRVTTYKHNASIELAEKVIDDEDRLLNVLAHEFCHLANFMVSNVKDQPHGRSFKEWAHKVTTKFPHKNIDVTTKHSYIIDYKYVWGCVECGLEYKRHSRSIHPGRHSCGTCKGKLVQIKPVPRTGARSGNSAPKTDGVNPYQAFVRQWYAVVKKEHTDWKMKEIMSELARRYKSEKETDITQKSEVKTQHVDVSANAESDIVIVISDNESISADQQLVRLGEQMTTLVLD